MTRRIPGRRKPYTVDEIGRQRCAACGGQATRQVYACADGLHRPSCDDCEARFVQECLTLVGLAHDPQGRRTPYTPLGLYRTPCVSCGARRSRYQWTIGRGFRPLCGDCDIRLNEHALRDCLRLPDAEIKLAAYRERVASEADDVPLPQSRTLP